MSFNPGSPNPKTTLFITTLCDLHFPCLVSEIDYIGLLWLPWVVRIWYWSTEINRLKQITVEGRADLRETAFTQSKKPQANFSLPCANIFKHLLIQEGKKWEETKNLFKLSEFCYQVWTRTPCCRDKRWPNILSVKRPVFMSLIQLQGDGLQ